MQFFVLMVDYGKGPQRPMGYAADVQPEFTRADIVDQVRQILKEDRNSVAFVKFIDGNYCEDQTAEIVEEAYALLANEETPLSPADIQSAAFDHALDLVREQMS